MATGYWVGADNALWTANTSWRTTASGTTGTVPSGTSQQVFFSHNSVSTSRTTYLNGNRTIADIQFLSHVSGTYRVRGGTSSVPATNTLTLSGVSNSNSASASLIFESSVSLVFNGPQNLSAKAGTTVEVYGSVSGASYIGVGGPGTTVLGHSWSTPGAFVVVSGGTARVASSTGLGSADVEFYSGTLSATSSFYFPVGVKLASYGNSQFAFFESAYTSSLSFSGNLIVLTPATVTFNAASIVYFAGSLTSQGIAAQSLTLRCASGVSGATLRLVGPLSAFNSSVDVGTGVAVQLAEYTSGTPNQFNNASLVTLQPSSRLTFYGNTGTNINCNITFGGAGGGFLTVVNPQTLTFTGTTFTNNGPFEVIAESTNGLTQTQRVIFTLASQVGTPQYYAFYSSSGVTYTSLTQVIEYTGSAAATNGKIIFIDHTSNNGGTSVLRNNSGNGSTFNQTASIRHNRPTIAETLNIDAVGGPMVFSSTGTLLEMSSGVLTVTKTGNYDVTLSGANNFRGNYTNSAGTTKANNATALGANNAATVSVASLSSLSLDVACTYNAGKILSLTGVGVAVAGGNTGALIINNAGTNTFSGGVTLNGAVYIRATASGTLAAALTSSGANFRIGAAAGATATFSGAISGTNGFLIGRKTDASADTGTVVLTAANTFAAWTWLCFGSLSIDADNKLGTAPGSPTAEYLRLGQGTTFKATGTFTLNANRGLAVGPSGYDLASGPGTIEVATGQTLTYNGIIANNTLGAGALAKTGAGTLSLGAANTYSGGTSLTTGTLRANHLTALGSGPVTQAAGTVLQTPASDGKLNVSGAYSNNGGTLRIGGA